MTGDDETGYLRDAYPVAVEGDRVRRQRVLRWPGRRPPEMRERHRALTGRDHCRNVLRRVTRGLEQVNGWAEGKAFRRTTPPSIGSIDRPEIMKASLGKKRAVECVVRVVVGTDDVGDLVW